MFCPNCGTKLEDGAVFCTSCGVRIAQDTPTPVQPEQPADSAQQPPSPKRPSNSLLRQNSPISGTRLQTTHLRTPGSSPRRISSRPLSSPSSPTPCPAVLRPRITWWSTLC